MCEPVSSTKYLFVRFDLSSATIRSFQSEALSCNKINQMDEIDRIKATNQQRLVSSSRDQENVRPGQTDNKKQRSSAKRATAIYPAVLLTPWGTL